MKGDDNLKIILDRKACYCNLRTFYSNVAKNLGIDVTDDTIFDCTKVCITKVVEDALWDYYHEEEGLSGFEISTMFLHVGSKANIELKDGVAEYTVDVASGFIVH